MVSVLAENGKDNVILLAQRFLEKQSRGKSEEVPRRYEEDKADISGVDEIADELWQAATVSCW